MYKQRIVSAIIPAKNEVLSIRKVVSGLFDIQFNGQPLFDNIVVCDNGSTDNTDVIAKEQGAIVIRESRAGYGQACLTAMSALPNTDIIVFIDGDHSFYPEQSLRLVKAIYDGADLAIGSRVLGTIERRALTIPQLFGNWLASKLIYILWKHSITDLGPFRAISYKALLKLNMKDPRFGWTVEMQIKAIQHKMKIIELAVDTRKRIGVSKISGTIRGVIGAALGIFGTIYKLWVSERSASGKTPLNEAGEAK